MALDLTLLQDVLAKEPGLQDNLSPEQMAAGLAAADVLMGILTQVIGDHHLNDDGTISAADMEAISAAVQGDADLLARFTAAHGDDAGDTETGYHQLQNDGGSVIFQGRNLVDSVVDSIFHFGFQIVDGHFLNEDGDQNQQVPVVAGWLNYFLNGVTTVQGSDAADSLGSGRYSPMTAGAANELWYAGAGNDSVWADEGDDTVWGGSGDDAIGGSYGNDLINGEDGNDDLGGQQGHDRINGGAGDDGIDGGSGRDTLAGGDGNDWIAGGVGNDALTGCAGEDTVYGGTGNDTVGGGAGNDLLSGDGGNDTVNGGAGNDQIGGGSGDDLLQGAAGNDTLCGGAGADTVQGGAGGDVITLWEEIQARDVLVFAAGDAGKTRAMIDHVEGFQSGTDKIDLRAFAGMTFEEIDFSDTGGPSCFFDGRYLRIDGNGDGRCDMIAEFKWQDQLVADDFLTSPLAA